MEQPDAVPPFPSAAPSVASHADLERLRVQLAYSVDDVAILLNVSPRTVESLIAKGLLKSTLVPGTTRARRGTRAQLQAFVLNMELEYGFKRPKGLDCLC
jgi:excisionase family DNA binding protein